jgi:hypothetical protein
MGELGCGIPRCSIVETVASFYNLLPLSPPSGIRAPPPTGCPQATVAYLRKLGKTNTVHFSALAFL